MIAVRLVAAPRIQRVCMSVSVSVCLCPLSKCWENPARKTLSYTHHSALGASWCEITDVCCSCPSWTCPTRAASTGSSGRYCCCCRRRCCSCVTCLGESIDKGFERAFELLFAVEIAEFSIATLDCLLLLS